MVRGGAIYVRPRGDATTPWRELPVPPCFAGHVAAISADDDELSATLAAVEAAAVPAGRELTRKAVEAALQAQAEAAEKGGDRPGAAPAAGQSAGARDAPPATS